MKYIKNLLTDLKSGRIFLGDGWGRWRRHEEGAQVAIEIRLDLMLVKKKMTLTELASRVGVSITNLSLLKTGKVKGIRFSTLEAICRELECQPGDLLEYVSEYV
jgi:putative transcriptional regulator